jgi:hypothetical protein
MNKMEISLKIMVIIVSNWDFYCFFELINCLKTAKFHQRKWLTDFMASPTQFLKKNTTKGIAKLTTVLGGALKYSNMETHWERSLVY